MQWEIKRAGGEPVQSEGEGARSPAIPLSFAQRRLLSLNRQDGSCALCNVSVLFALSGFLNIGALNDALIDLVKRHEILRTVFQNGTDMCVQPITSPALSSILKVERVSEDRVAEALASACKHRFDLSTEIPVRAHLFAVPPASFMVTPHILAIVFHNYAFDTLSLAPLCRDLSDAYIAHLHGRSPDWHNLPVQYSEYTLREHGLLQANDENSLLVRDRTFWTGMLEGLPDGTEFWNRPVQSKSSDISYRFIQMRINPALHRKLMILAEEQSTSLIVILHTALAVLISEYSPSKNIPIGIITSGRDTQSLEHAIGAFENVLMLCVNTSGNPTFLEMFERVRENHRLASLHKNFPFERLIEAISATKACILNQIALSLRSKAGIALKFPNVASTVSCRDTVKGAFDIVFDMTEGYAPDGRPEGIEGRVSFRTDIFRTQTISEMIDQFLNLLNAAITDPAQHIEHHYRNAAKEGLCGTDKNLFSPAVIKRRHKWEQIYIPARDALQARIGQIWEDLFGASNIGIRDKFSDLGGNPQLAEQMLHEVEKVYGKKLTFTVNYSGLTIEALGDAMARQMPESPIIEVQAGDGKKCAPLFFVHGDIFGGGWYVFELARGLDPDQSLYMLPPHGLNGYRIPDTMDQMVSDLIYAISRIQPRGPYYLGGYCNGALIALEIADFLRMKGEDVPLLAMVDAPFLWGTSEVDDRSIASPVTSASAGSTQKAGMLFQISELTQLHRPNTYDGVIHLFKGRDSLMGSDTFAWQDIAPNHEFHLIPGDHKGCITRHVMELAGKIGSIMKTTGSQINRSSRAISHY